jgi:hypothetical protein
MKQEVLSHTEERVTTGVFFDAISVHLRYSRSSLFKQPLAAILVLISTFLLQGTANAAVMNVFYDSASVSVSSIDSPPGTVVSAQDAGHLLESIPNATNYEATVTTNTATSSAYAYSYSYGDSIYVDLSTNLDDVRIFDTNSTRSIWNTLFSIDGDGASLDVMGRLLNTDYLTSEVYLFDITARTLDVFDGTSGTADKILQDGHLYALSSISEQKTLGHGFLVTQTIFNSVNLNYFAGNQTYTSPTPPTIVESSNVMGQEERLLTSFQEVNETYSSYITIAEPSSFLILGMGLICLAMAGLSRKGDHAEVGGMGR